MRSTISYSYNNSEWRDLLTAYNGKSITYDAIGNPLSDGTWTYAWQHGRQLASMSKTGSSITYGYNADGKRISKTVNGTTYRQLQPHDGADRQNGVPLTTKMPHI